MDKFVEFFLPVYAKDFYYSSGESVSEDKANKLNVFLESIQSYFGYSFWFDGFKWGDKIVKHIDSAIGEMCDCYDQTITKNIKLFKNEANFI